MNAIVVNETQTSLPLCLKFYQAMQRHDAAEAAGDDAGMTAAQKEIEAIEAASVLTPPRDGRIDIAHRVCVALRKMNSIFDDATLGFDIGPAVDDVEALLCGAIVTLMMGEPTDRCRLDYYHAGTMAPRGEPTGTAAVLGECVTMADAVGKMPARLTDDINDALYTAINEIISAPVETAADVATKFRLVAFLVEREMLADEPDAVVAAVDALAAFREAQGEAQAAAYAEAIAAIADTAGRGERHHIELDA
jgi:hypothetical protein